MDTLKKIDTPSTKVILGREERTLKYGFQAFHELGLNPFHPQTVLEFIRGLDPMKAAAWIRAGLLHEYGAGGPKSGTMPPTADDLMDLIDTDFVFGAIDQTLSSWMETGYMGFGKQPAEAAAV